MSVLSQAYGFLCAQDVISARLVCKAWRVPALWHQITLCDKTHSLANLLTLCFPLNVRKCTIKGQDPCDDFNTVKRMQRLQTLEITNGRDITAEQLKETVEALPLLEDVIWRQFGSSFDTHFASFLQPFLKIFSFQPIMQHTTDQDITEISRMTHLKQLGLGCCAQMQEGGFVHIKALTQLEKLTMYNSHAGIGIAHLASVLNMRSLALVRCQVGTAEIACIATLPHLEELVLFANSQLTNEAFEGVVFPKLKTLDLRSCPLISDIGLLHLIRFTGLERLDVGSCNGITDRGLASVAEMVGLTDLSIKNCLSVTDQGLAHLTALVNLTKFNFASTNIGDGGCMYVSLMVALQHLDMAVCNEVTDVGLSYIARVSTLRFLNVQNCNKVTIAALEQLQTAFPSLTLVK